MLYTKPNFDYYTTNRDKAQASWPSIGRAERQAYIDLARLYLDLSIQDAEGNTAPTEDAAKVKKAERDAEHAEWLAGQKAGDPAAAGTGVKNWSGPNTKTG